MGLGGYVYSTGEPSNKGHFVDDINSIDLLFVERFSSLGGSKCIVETYTGIVSRALCGEVYYTLSLCGSPLSQVSVYLQIHSFMLGKKHARFILSILQSIL